MDFITWFFDKHYIAPTLLMPAMTLGWAFWTHSVARALASVGMYVAWMLPSIIAAFAK